MQAKGFTQSKLILCAGCVLVLVGCAQTKSPAPVESRVLGKGAPAKSATAPASSAAPSVSADGYYRVRKGDTLIGISLDHGVSWRDLAAWNQIDNPNLIEVDQLIRVKPPKPTRSAAAGATGATGATANQSTDSGPAKIDVRPLASSKPAAATGPGTASTASAGSKIASGAATAAASIPAPGTVPALPPAMPPVASAAPSAASSAASSASAAKAAEGITLSWPGKGNVITQFADPGYKGIALSGAEGDPVTAAADGRVVYSGNGLRGYGNLVIVKHDGDFLTAYAHNKAIMVTEGQQVKRGQKIAELGKTDTDQPKLHFEVRKSGKPVDPLKFLAQR